MFPLLPQASSLEVGNRGSWKRDRFDKVRFKKMCGRGWCSLRVVWKVLEEPVRSIISSLSESSRDNREYGIGPGRVSAAISWKNCESIPVQKTSRLHIHGANRPDPTNSR